MPVTSIRFYSGPVRRQPRLGDRRTTKKHGEQVRVLDIIQSGPHRGALRVSGSRPCWVWVDPEEAYRRHQHLRPKPAPEERPTTTKSVA